MWLSLSLTSVKEKSSHTQISMGNEEKKINNNNSSNKKKHREKNDIKKPK